MALSDSERRARRDHAWDYFSDEVSKMTRRLKEYRGVEDLSDANARVKANLDDLRDELANWPGYACREPEKHRLHTVNLNERCPYCGRNE